MAGKTVLIIGITVAVTLSHVMTSDATAALWVCKNADGRTQIRDWPCDDPSILPYVPGRDIRPQPPAPSRSDTPSRPETPPGPATPSNPAASADAKAVTKLGVSAPAVDGDAERAKQSATTSPTATPTSTTTTVDSEEIRHQRVTVISDFDPPVKRSMANRADAKKRPTGKKPKQPETHKANDVARESHAKVLRSVKSKCETGLQAAGRAGASCN